MKVVVVVDLYIVKMPLFTIFVANYFFILVIILHLYNTICKQKWINTIGDIRQSVTILLY